MQQQQASPAQASAVSGSPTPSSLSSTRSFSNALFQKINRARMKATSKIPGIRRNKPQAESPRNAPASKRSSQASTHRVLTGDDLYSGRPDLVLGTLDVALVKGKDLQGIIVVKDRPSLSSNRTTYTIYSINARRQAKEPFVKIHLENHRRRSSHASVDKSSGTVEWEDARWSLEVTDLASDLHVVLFASHQFRTPQPLGRVIVMREARCFGLFAARIAQRDSLGKWYRNFPMTVDAQWYQSRIRKVSMTSGCCPAGHA